MQLGADLYNKGFGKSPLLSVPCLNLIKICR